MNLWEQWLASIGALLNLLSLHIGLGAGLGIVALTLLLRLAMLPMSWSNGYRGYIRQRKLLQLQPELQKLKERFAERPQLYVENIKALYSQHGLTFFDARGVLGSLAQMPLLLGMYQTLRNITSGSHFLWIKDLSRPDAWLALAAGLTTLLMMTANPNLPADARLLLIVVPSILAIIAALKFCSALAVYWTASNCFSALQTVILHRVVSRRIQSGAINI